MERPEQPRGRPRAGSPRPLCPSQPSDCQFGGGAKVAPAPCAGGKLRLGVQSHRGAGLVSRQLGGMEPPLGPLAPLSIPGVQGNGGGWDLHESTVGPHGTQLGGALGAPRPDRSLSGSQGPVPGPAMPGLVRRRVEWEGTQMAEPGLAGGMGVARAGQGLCQGGRAQLCAEPVHMHVGTQSAHTCSHQAGQRGWARRWLALEGSNGDVASSGRRVPTCPADSPVPTCG